MSQNFKSLHSSSSTFLSVFSLSLFIYLFPSLSFFLSLYLSLFFSFLSLSLSLYLYLTFFHSLSEKAFPFLSWIISIPSFGIVNARPDKNRFCKEGFLKGNLMPSHKIRIFVFSSKKGSNSFFSKFSEVLKKSSGS